MVPPGCELPRTVSGYPICRQRPVAWFIYRVLECRSSIRGRGWDPGSPRMWVASTGNGVGGRVHRHRFDRGSHASGSPAESLYRLWISAESGQPLPDLGLGLVRAVVFHPDRQLRSWRGGPGRSPGRSSRRSGGNLEFAVVADVLPIVSQEHLDHVPVPQPPPRPSFAEAERCSADRYGQMNSR